MKQAAPAHTNVAPSGPFVREVGEERGGAMQVGTRHAELRRRAIERGGRDPAVGVAGAPQPIEQVGTR